MNEHISVMTDFGELIATPFAGGISVDINLPDGKGSGQLAFIESTPAELQDDYPTPVHVFSYDGRDSEPVHRTDVHLDGDAMTLDPVKGTPAHNGAQAHGGDRHPADLAKAASAAANRTAGRGADPLQGQGVARPFRQASGRPGRRRVDSYDDVVNLFGADEAAAMLADVVGNRFNRQEILKAIRNGGDIHLDYWPEYGEYGYAARICGELLADTSLAWADGLIDPDKIKTHKGLTAGDLSHAVTCVLTDRFNDGLDEARLADCKNIADEFAQAIESRLGSGRLGRELYVDSGCLRDDLTDKFGFFYDIDFSGLSFKTSLILSVNGLYSEGDVIDAASDWQEDYLPCVCHRGGQGEDDRWEYEPAEDYRPFTRPADIPESIFDKLCASQGTTIEKVVNDPVTPFERSFREDIFNMPQNRPVGLAVLATLPLDAFLDASLSMIRRGEGENAGTFTVKPGTYEPIFGIYDPVGGCGGTMGTVLDRDFEIDPHDITYTMMEPLKGEWQSDRIDLYTPQDCFGFSDPFGGRIEYSEKPKIAVKAKSEPAELGRRAATAAGASARDGADSRGIKL